MLEIEKVDELEKLIGQLDGLHSELGALAKKSPNDAVNKFKLHFINSALLKCNSFLGEDYQPFDDFQQFNEDEVPSNSDITFILSQYIQSLEKFRSDNIYTDMGSWYYRLTDKKNKIRTGPPSKLKKK